MDYIVYGFVMETFNVIDKCMWMYVITKEKPNKSNILTIK